MEATDNSQPSPSFKEQPLPALSFPKKLWKIVNECKTGAIAWSADGKSVVVDYTKFKSHYLGNRLGIFKTKKINSFVRQLNLYGFRKISPLRSTTEGSAGGPDLHVYWNRSFARDRPDMLSSVSRKKCASRAKANKAGDGGGPGPSSKGQGHFHGPAKGARVLRNQGNAAPTQHIQVPVARSVGVQRPAVQVVEQQLSHPPGTAQSAVATSSQATPCEYNRDYWSTDLWNSKDSTSDMKASDEEDGCSQFSVAKDQHTGASAAPPATIAGEVVVDYEASDIFVDDLMQHTMPSSDSPSHSADMATLLDPNQPYSVVLTMHGSEDENNLTPSMEEFLVDPMVDPSFRPVGESDEDDFSLTSL